MHFSEIACKYLESCKILYSAAFVESRMKSHPDYPALLSFTDTLDELGLMYSAVQAEDQHITKMSFPWLAGTPKAVNSFEIIPSLQYYENNKERFLNRWDGVAVMVNAFQSINNKEHEVFLKGENKTLSNIKIAVGIGLFVFLLANTLYFSFPLFLFSLLSIAGIVICGLIVLHSLGQGNTITEKLCSTEKSQSCNLVLNSKVAKLANGVGMGDAGLIYFITLFLFAMFGMVSQNTHASLSLLLVPAGLALSFTLFSVYYQWKIVKAWCRMCLIVAVIVWLQATIPFGHFIPVKQLSIYELIPVILQFVIAISLASLWLLIKTFLRLRIEQRANIIEVLKWRRNPEIFQSLLYKQSETNTLLPGNPAFLGNAEATLQFAIVSNPFCRPCATAHQQLDELLKKYSDLVGLSIIFLTRQNDKKEDRRVVAIEHILKAIAGENTKEQVLRDWFDNMNLEKFRAKYPSALENTDISFVLREYQQWAAKNYVPHTPIVYLNGYQIPKQYNLEDIKSFVVELSDILTQPIAKNKQHEEVANLSWQ